MKPFCWGVATAAYQIEGGWDADGKGPSVWDTLAHRPGGLSGVTGDVACDHYHRLEEDLELLAGLGVTSYRFSVSWPRALTPAGMGFYDRIVDGLLARGIEPTVTLYHWDHPQTIEDAGGWTTPDTAARFADYAAIVAERLGDRVTRWITLNEPQSVVVGNMLGFSRPAGPLGRAGLAIAHNLLLAHAVGVERVRELTGGEVGISLNVSGVRPATDQPEDVAAAARADAYEDRLFLDPILRGAYPCVDGAPVLDADASEVNVPIDFLGLNWYAPALVARTAGAPSGPLDELLGGLEDLVGYARVPIPGAPTSMLGGSVAPAGLGTMLRDLVDRYPNLPPLYITENGMPLPESVHDPDRIAYLGACIAHLRDAIERGVDVRGYFVWSLMDNLEWGLGFEPRFGLVHVDFETLARTPKDSYHWYREVIRGG